MLHITDWTSTVSKSHRSIEPMSNVRRISREPRRPINHGIAHGDRTARTRRKTSSSRAFAVRRSGRTPITEPHLASYAAEASWREDNRRVDNRGLAEKVASAAMASGTSRQLAGYWQKGRVINARFFG